MGIKKSRFLQNTAIPSGASMDFWINGTNYQIPVEVLYAAVASYINPLSLVVNNVTSPYLVSDADTGTFLIFDDASTADVQIPDNLSTGVNLAYTNIGLGSVQLVMTGVDVLRGEPLVADADGYAAVTKISVTTWQTSER